MENNKRYYGYIISAGALWGVMGLFVRALSAYGFDSMSITALRLISGAVMLTVFVAVYDKSLFKISIRDLPVFLAMGILSILMMSWLYFNAIIRIDLSASAMLLYTAPVWVLVASVILYGERLTVAKSTALVLAVLGCVLISGISFGERSVSGILFGAGSGVAYALYSIIGKHALKKYHPITVTVYTFILAGLASLMLCPAGDALGIINSGFDTAMLLWILGIGLVTVAVPYMLYTTGLSRVPAGGASITASAEPMVATVAGIAIYREVPDLTGFLGIAMILGAIILLSKSE